MEFVPIFYRNYVGKRMFVDVAKAQHSLCTVVKSKWSYKNIMTFYAIILRGKNNNSQATAYVSYTTAFAKWKVYHPQRACFISQSEIRLPHTQHKIPCRRLAVSNEIYPRLFSQEQLLRAATSNLPVIPSKDWTAIDFNDHHNSRTRDASPCNDYFEWHWRVRVYLQLAYR